MPLTPHTDGFTFGFILIGDDIVNTIMEDEQMDITNKLKSIRKIKMSKEMRERVLRNLNNATGQHCSSAEKKNVSEKDYK